MNSIKESPNVPEQIAKKTLNEFKQVWIEISYQDILSIWLVSKFVQIQDLQFRNWLLVPLNKITLHTI